MKEAVWIPVIGNGNIFMSENAERMPKETGRGGIMMAGEVKGNPWPLDWIDHYLGTGGVFPGPSIAEIRVMVLRHGRALVQFKEEGVVV